ncbi:MAG TPA: hypothetical protein VLG46_12920, partial [Anaerolineae bacterium]|nr:hypothetical protein [Anaerolineae bacterium]
MKDTATRRTFKLLFRLLTYRSPTLPVPPQGVTLSDVTVVNPGRDRQAHQTIVIAGDQITQLSSDDAPPSAASHQPIVCPNAYVLPGLIDMHVHVPPLTRDLVGLLFLLHGVTTIRETGDADGSTWQARERIRDGHVPGPRIFASGAVLDGKPPFLPTSWGLSDPGEAREAVARLAALGANFIKVHHKVSPQVLVAIREAAQQHGLRTVGHIPISVPFEQAGIWDVQHLDGVVPYPQSHETPLDVQKKWRDLDPARIDFYVRTSVEQGLAHTATLVTTESLLKTADPHSPDDPAVHWLPRYYREGIWDRRYMPLFERFTDETLSVMKQAQQRALEVVGRLNQSGVRLHLGTDSAAMPFLVPGISLQRELELMVEAGLELESAWIAGTSAASESLDLPRLGTLQAGAPADCLLFDD